MGSESREKKKKIISRSWESKFIVAPCYGLRNKGEGDMKEKIINSRYRLYRSGKIRINVVINNPQISVI